MPDVTIVIPAINEEKRLRVTVPAYLEYFKETVNLLIVDNGSRDGTIDYLKDLEAKHRNISHLEFDEALGKGGAVYAGFNAATTKYVGFVDADISTPPREFEKLINAITNESVDIAIASRWLKGARMDPPQPWSRRVNGRLFNVFVNLMFGLQLSDTQCGAKLMKKEVYEDIKDKLTLKGFSFDVELLWQAKKAGFKVTEVPITWKYIPGHSFNPFKGGMKAVLELLRIASDK